MNYHVKSGASSLKIDWVMLILDFGDQFVFGGRFVFWQKKCGGPLWTNIQNLDLLDWKLVKLCSI